MEIDAISVTGREPPRITQYVSRVVSYTSQWSDDLYVRHIESDMTHSLTGGLPIKLLDFLMCTHTVVINTETNPVYEPGNDTQCATLY